MFTHWMSTVVISGHSKKWNIWLYSGQQCCGPPNRKQISLSAFSGFQIQFSKEAGSDSHNACGMNFDVWLCQKRKKSRISTAAAIWPNVFNPMCTTAFPWGHAWNSLLQSLIWVQATALVIQFSDNEQLGRSRCWLKHLCPHHLCGRIR